MEGDVIMRVMIGIALILIVMTGCHSDENIGDVVNKHNNIQNLNDFVENVNNQSKAKINYVQYGVEGQRGERTVTYDGEKISVYYSVDGNFVEEYNCTGIIIERDNDIEKYVLSGCSGSFNGDFELLTVSNEE